jgi:hypothetical protein
MGREIPVEEHSISGTVTVGRPVRNDIMLPPEIAQLQRLRFLEIDAIKHAAGLAVSTQAEAIEPQQ